MKLNNSNKQDKIIGTDDIFISSNNSSIGNDLEALLTKLDLEIEDLKRNVKWLYKYGGVGGSGGSGSSENTKATFTITYTNTNDLTTTTKLTNGDIINILKGTPIIVTCQITSKRTAPEYKFSISDTLGETYITLKNTDIKGSITITPQENTLYDINVIGETIVKLSFNVFTDIVNIRSRISSNGEYIESNSAIYLSQLAGSEYIFTLENNQPSLVSDEITGVLINNVVLSTDKYELNTVEDSISNRKATTLKISSDNIFSEFDIYQILVNYTVNDEGMYKRDTFIYLSDEAFVYCYSSGILVYNKEVDSPISSNAYLQTIYYKIYKAKEDDLARTYTVTINGTLQTGAIKAGEVKSYSFLNDTESENPTSKLLTFKVDNNDIEFNYYVYLTKPKEVSYFFKDENGANYYLAVYTNTDPANANTNIMEFPMYDLLENAYIITKEQTFPLKEVARNKGDAVNAKNNIKNYITSSVTANNPRLDGLFSFGIKYSSNNHLLPILYISGAYKVTMYKNYIEYNNAQYEICIPKDDKYHLVQLYFKSNYNNSPDVDTDIANHDLKLCVFIDGIIESLLIPVNDFYVLKNTSITYCVGNWKYNHIGVATFNAKELITIDEQHDCIWKYLLDFDPIIPVNYYSAYKLKILEELGYLLDSSIYNSLGVKPGQSNNLWINYYCYNNGNDYFTKLINVDPLTIATLLGDELEMYCITPEQTTYPDFDQYKGFNLFLYNTFKSYSEDDTTPVVNCSFLKWVGNTFKDLITNLNGINVQFQVRYQGSSTLLYSCKNFEISTVSYTDTDEKVHPIYFTPDVNLFPRLEQSFNLKADIVDSSHSNNVIVGNFVNDYMTSPFNKNELKYKACLTGKPILLFIKNTLSKEDTSSDYIFLGIYSMNLNRGSVHNLGYSRILAGNKEIEVTDDTVLDAGCCDTITKFHLLSSSETDESENDFAVAEIQGNGSLYDFSKFDELLLSKEVLGDFYTSENNRVGKSFTKYLIEPFKALAKIINTSYSKDFKYTDPCRIEDNQYEQIKDNNCYYKDLEGKLKPVPENALVISKSTLLAYTKNVPYHTYEGNMGLISNPKKQYHLICNKDEEIFYKNSLTFYYVEELSVLSNYTDEDPKVDLKTALQYYIVCMAFGMADSVLKNLTIKCPNVNDHTWYSAFYDMDTAFGKNNAGGNLSFLAFSNYVDDEGNIISDYSPISGNESLFDIPSSFLFLYAKYYGLLTEGKDAEFTPAKEWCNLRQKGGRFENSDIFCAKYIDNYFGDINPLIWNLNYLYKYFSTSDNTNSDTEESRFSGTRRYSRKEFITDRFRYLDAMFGINTAQYIGNSSINIFDGATIPTNSDITMNLSIVPGFKKGSIGNFSVKVLDDPKTPIFFKTSSRSGILKITDLEGMAEFNANITTSEDLGFFGTLNLLSASEFGQFLGGLNMLSIVGNRITEIDIYSGGSDVTLNMDNIPEVENIVIGDKSLISYNTFTIKNNLKLKTITINKLKCNSLTIDSTNTIELSIQNSTITSLSLLNLTLSKFTHSDNSITSESWSNINVKELNGTSIVNPACVNLTLNNVTIPNLNYSSSSGLLTKLSISNIKTDTIEIPYGLSLTNLTLKLINAKNINFNTKLNLHTSANYTPWFTFTDNTNSIEDIEIGVVNDVESIGIAFPYFYKLKTFNISGNKLKKCILNDRAFEGCSELTELTNTIPEYIIKGDRVFNKVISLPADTKLACTLDETKEYQGIFVNNTDIDIEFVIKWFQKHSAASLERLFSYCTGIKLIYKNNQLPNRYPEFVKAFKKALDNVPSNILPYFHYTFYNTGINVLTTDITNEIAKKCLNKEFYSPLSPCKYENKEIEDPDIVYLGKLALNNFYAYRCTWEHTRGTNYFQIKVLDEDNKVISDATIDDYFDDSCKMKELLYFNPFTNSTTAFDFKEGLPTSITRAYICSFGANYDNFKNLENIFNKNHNITFNGYYFMNSISLLSNNKVDLFKMFFEENDGLVTAKVKFANLEGIKSYIGCKFSKTITKENFYKILLYFEDNKITYINGFFRDATITDSDENILKDKLKPFTKLPYAFTSCKFVNSKKQQVYVDITNAFGEFGKDDLLGDTNIKYDLYYTFAGNYLKPFSNRLNIYNVTDMYYAFAESLYNYTNVDTISLILPENMQMVYAYDIPLLPEGFFDICSSTCDLTMCFYYNNYNNGALTGRLDEEDAMGLSNIQGKKDYMFYKCHIVYYKKTIDEGTRYVIFPNWYNKLNFKAKYFVYIPFPASDTESDNTVYLFESTTASNFNGLFSTLPILAEGNNNSFYYDIALLDVFAPKDNPTYFYKVALDGDLIPNNSTAYKYLLPKDLALVLFLLRNSTIVNSINTASKNNKPLLRTDSGTYDSMAYSISNKAFSSKSSYFFGTTINDKVSNILK